jgi:hypothetical protein
MIPPRGLGLTTTTSLEGGWVAVAGGAGIVGICDRTVLRDVSVRIHHHLLIR